jgi:EAL domain-containing protein (putative c-di-GMP-specific phosphodiesterase class I)
LFGSPIGHSSATLKSVSMAANSHDVLLKNLNVDCVKIDGLFVRGMIKDPTDHAMVISMNDIAHFLGQKTVAEYVESGEILTLLSDCGVDHVQGFFIARPIPEQLACPGETLGDTLLLDTEELE